MKRGNILSRTTVQHLTNNETDNPVIVKEIDISQPSIGDRLMGGGISEEEALDSHMIRTLKWQWKHIMPRERSQL